MVGSYIGNYWHYNHVPYIEMFKINLFLSLIKVASGLPERSEIKKHVSEIATMALDLLHASSYFKVPHSPNETVQVRIGIHTGSCGAGKYLNIHDEWNGMTII